MSSSHWPSYKVHPGYESVLADLFDQLKVLRATYKDTTWHPPKIWPLQSIDYKNCDTQEGPVQR